jgi:hypothetical protein
MERSRPLTDPEFDSLVAVGHDVLRAFPHKVGACMMMSTLYVGRLHDLGHQSARLVGGALAIGDEVVFGRFCTTTSFAVSNLDWDGHAWVMFGEYLADMSLVMTAYSEDAPPLVAKHMRVRRKPNQRLSIFTPKAAWRDDGLAYTAQHIFTNDEIAPLYRGALTFLS